MGPEVQRAGASCPHPANPTQLTSRLNPCDCTRADQYLSSTCPPSLLPIACPVSRHCLRVPQVSFRCISPASRTLVTAWLVPSSGGTALYLITTPPTRKRKASEADGQLTPSEGPPQKRQTPESLHPDLPATPVTNASDKMDSEDEFNSSMSGNDFDDDSDMDLEDGTGHVQSAQSCY